MGKSLKGKELGKGISQRKDGRYQARFINRFGKRQTIYEMSLQEVRNQLKREQYEDFNSLNVIDRDMTLDKWYEIWMDTCKRNCRNSTKETYAGNYRRIQKELGWMKLSNLNLIVLQQVFNDLESDNARANSKKILVDMLDKAVDSDLLIKNVAKQINTKVSYEKKSERRVLTVSETDIFLKEAKATFYYDLYILALETGLRIGEITALKWSDVDDRKKVLHICRTLCYFSKDGKYTFEMHDTKTINGRRSIPLTQKAYEALQRQRIRKNKIEAKGIGAMEGFEDLVFVTRNNRPTQTFIVKECMDVCIRRIQKKHPEFQTFSPHCFRHTFATRAVENGVPQKTLQRILGHGSLQMTMDLYCHVTDDTLFEAMRLMESVNEQIV